MASEVVVGKVIDAYGVKGWLKIQSFTRPPSNILSYAPWKIEVEGNEKKSLRLIKGKVQGNVVLVQVEGVEARDIALEYKQRFVWVARDSLPKMEGGGYYWADLVGLHVFNVNGIDFGKVESLIETGANDVLVAKNGDKERLIPFVLDKYVKSVDLLAKRMLVDWDPDF